MGRGWRSLDWGDESMGKMRIDFCPNFLHLFLANFDGRRFNDQSRDIVPFFHTPLIENTDPLPPGSGRILVPS